MQIRVTRKAVRKPAEMLESLALCCANGGFERFVSAWSRAADWFGEMTW